MFHSTMVSLPVGASDGALSPPMGVDVVATPFGDDVITSTNDGGPIRNYVSAKVPLGPSYFVGGKIFSCVDRSISHTPKGNHPLPFSKTSPVVVCG